MEIARKASPMGLMDGFVGFTVAKVYLCII